MIMSCLVTRLVVVGGGPTEQLRDNFVIAGYYMQEKNEAKYVCRKVTFYHLCTLPGIFQGRTQDLGAQVAYPGYKKCGGGGRFRSDIRKVGGGGALQVRYTKSGGGGGGGGRFRSHIRKVGGGGHSASDTFGHAENMYMYLPTCYLGILHTRARMSVKYMPAKVNLL